jgi:rod shape determining protein RodA
MRIGSADQGPLTLGQKLWQLNWGLVLLLVLLAAIGAAMLYSAANARWDPWASRQLMRFALGLVLMLAVAVTDIRLWMRYAFALYFLALGLLVAVEIMGVIGMGAQRWIDLGVIQLQPSEIMKIALVLALARYFHGATLEEIARPSFLIVPVMLIGAPVALVVRQPDLGTAIMLALTAGLIFFVAGVRAWKFGLVIGAVVAAMPLGWSQLHGYQKRRILTFLDPESDPLGAGYHILQSKIALGSGGVFGKGFLGGTQSHLSFLPEKQTDFIFTMLAEEFGMAGGLALLSIYALVLVYGFAISLRVRNQFGRLVVMGITGIFFFYVFINIAMVMGLVPVVGVPLPLVSYGGTAMLSLMIGFGFVLCAYVHRDVRVGRHGDTRLSTAE